MPALRYYVPGGWSRLRSGPHPDRARQDAETLLLHVLEKSKAWHLAHLDDELPENQANEFTQLIERRFRGEPIQHIIGSQEFYGLPFRVTPDVLIPRPETEHVVEKAVELATLVRGSVTGHDVCLAESCTEPDSALEVAEKLDGLRETEGMPPSGAKARVFFQPFAAGLKSGQVTKPAKAPLEASLSASSSAAAGFPRILDVGTGSGAIAVALAHHLPKAQITALDISPAALEIARENALRNAVSDRIRFLQSDLLDGVAAEKFEIVVSNPPYVPTVDRESLSVEVREHEPGLALFAGEDGLDVYRRLIPSAFAVLEPGGFLLLEIGHGQSVAIGALLTSAGFERAEFVPDLQGIPRVACTQRPA